MKAISYILLFLPAIAIGSFGLWKILPWFLGMLNPRSVRCWFADAFDRDQIISNSKDVQGRLEELRNLGFSLMGLKNEKFPLWGRGGCELTTVSIEANTFASIVLEKNEPYTVYFYTPLRETGFIYTRQQTTLPQLENSNFSVKNIASNNLNDLLNSHLERIKNFQQRGLFPAAVGSMESRLETTYQFFTSPYAKKIFRRQILYTSFPYLLVAGVMLFMQIRSLGYF